MAPAQAQFRLVSGHPGVNLVRAVVAAWDEGQVLPDIVILYVN
jgi:hypothetical protein